ncbi:MAG: hypothetical protein HDT28_09390 [Clostridiales bacterium]|nr:hypothetical protein [Clostridiales bacterium]
MKKMALIKKALIAAMLLVILVSSCFMFTACSSSNEYDGKKFLLEDVLVTYDETVSQEAKVVQEAQIEIIKSKIGGEKTPFCSFYEKPHIILTNYDGLYRFAKYEVANGKITMPQLTTSTTDKLSYHIDFYHPLSITNYSEKGNTASLENVDFAIEDGKLVLTESHDGITVKYVFAESGNVDESSNIVVDNKYSLWAVSYYNFDDESSLDKELSTAHRMYISSFASGIKFTASDKCKIGDTEYNITASKNRIDAKTGFIRIGTEMFLPQIDMYGDILILKMGGSTAGAKGSFDLYYILS